MIVIITGMSMVHAQENIKVIKASDIISKIIVVPDFVYNDLYTKKQNDLAIIKGKHLVSKKRALKFHNFNYYFETTKEFLTYKKGQKNKVVTVSEKKPEKFAWFIGSFTLIYFLVSLYIIIKLDVVTATFAVGILAIIAIIATLAIIVATDTATSAVGILTATATAISAAAALIAAALIAVATAAVVEELLIIKIWLTINIVGMAIIAYFFTPLFLVATVIGMSLAYILHKLSLKNKNKKY